MQLERIVVQKHADCDRPI